MKRVMVYSHDTFGLGNIRRILSVCEYLVQTLPDLDILILSGSGFLQNFTLPERTDYIKLPSLARDQEGHYGVKCLRNSMQDILALRSQLLLAAMIHYRPEILLVDKKPLGVEHDLEAAIEYAQTQRPKTRMMLLLRDVLDTPEETVRAWQKNQYHEVIARCYELILVVGSQDIFDVKNEYCFPKTSAHKVVYCGYLERFAIPGSRERLRQSLKLDKQPLVLVTAGGGGDGFYLIDNYARGIEGLAPESRPHSVVILGPEMPQPDKQAIADRLDNMAQITVLDFTQELIGWIDAADAIVSMGGYNSVCEALSLRKRTVIVPRVRPVEEQLIRTQRMAQRGLLYYLHPENMTPETLINAVLQQLEPDNVSTRERYCLDFNGLHCIADIIAGKKPDDQSRLASAGTI